MWLITGPEELLLRRKADELLARRREEAGGELDVVELRAPELGEQPLPDLRTASLFGAPRAVVIREAQTLPAEAARALAAELEGSPPEAVVLLLATSLGRIQTLAKRIKDVGGRIDQVPPREFEDDKWRRLIADELARHERRIDEQGVEALLERAGTNVSAIAERAAQVAAGAPAGTITGGHVEQLVTGHGSRGSFAVADAMCERQPDLALTRLRGVMADGGEPVMVLGALAHRLRAIVAVASVDRMSEERVDGLVARVDEDRRGKAHAQGKDPDQVKLLQAQQRDEQLSQVVQTFMGVKVTRGQLHRLRGVRRSFGPGELTGAVRVLADADAEMKGGELSPDLILERAVLAIADRDLEVQPQRVVPAVSGPQG